MFYSFAVFNQKIIFVNDKQITSIMEHIFSLRENQSKKEKYDDFVKQYSLLIEGEDDFIALLANTSAALRDSFGFFWVGFYLVKGEELVLGPFQGNVACFRIRKGRGVCGTAWAEYKTQLVPDVDMFPGHIACSSLSRSEIVIPMMIDRSVVGVLDIDSDRLNDFDEDDKNGLEKVVEILMKNVCGNI